MNQFPYEFPIIYPIEKLRVQWIGKADLIELIKPYITNDVITKPMSPDRVYCFDYDFGYLHEKISGNFDIYTVMYEYSENLLGSLKSLSIDLRKLLYITLLITIANTKLFLGTAPIAKAKNGCDILLIYLVIYREIAPMEHQKIKKIFYLFEMLCLGFLQTCSSTELATMENVLNHFNLDASRIFQKLKKIEDKRNNIVVEPNKQETLINHVPEKETKISAQMLSEFKKFPYKFPLACNSNNYMKQSLARLTEQEINGYIDTQNYYLIDNDFNILLQNLYSIDHIIELFINKYPDRMLKNNRRYATVYLLFLNATIKKYFETQANNNKEFLDNLLFVALVLIYKLEILYPPNKAKVNLKKNAEKQALLLARKKLHGFYWISKLLPISFNDLLSKNYHSEDFERRKPRYIVHYCEAYIMYCLDNKIMLKHQNFPQDYTHLLSEKNVYNLKAKLNRFKNIEYV